MSDFKLGDNVLLKNTLGVDTAWTVMFIEGEKIYCSSYDDGLGYQSIIVHESLLKQDQYGNIIKRQKHQ